MAKLRINGDSSGYVDLEAPNAASSSTLDLDQVPQKNAATTGFTGNVGVGISTPSTTAGGYDGGNLHVHNSGTGSSIRLTNNTTGTGTSSGMLISKWSDSNTYFTNFDNGANTIFTQSNSSGTLQTTIKLDGDGYVTTPQQPAFHASGGSQQTAAGIVQFITLMTNTGNHYNSSNYRFTAPTTGVYKFSARIMKAQNATVDFHFRVNGSQVGDNIYDTATATNQLNSGTANMVRHLNSGDYVQVYSASTSTVNWIHAGHREFSGYLIG